MGILLGYGIASFFSHFAKLAGLKSLRPMVTPELFLISGALSFGVGMVAGFFPARWASRLQPVEALRYE